MVVGQNTYDPEQAAEFLGITLEELEQLTQQGEIKLMQYKKRKYYLGGELDCIKQGIHQKLHEMTA